MEREELKQKGRIRLYFDDGTNTWPKYDLPLSQEDIVYEQMKRPKNKRLYKAGVEFSRVDRAEVVKKDNWGDPFGEVELVYRIGA